MSSAVIVVNVGGVLYETTRRTLAHRGGILAVMFDENNPWTAGPAYQVDGQARPFIDRDGDAFASVLAYLRTGIALVPADKSLSEVQVQLELNFYFPGPECPLAMRPSTVTLTEQHWYQDMVRWEKPKFIEKRRRECEDVDKTADGERKMVRIT